MVYLSTHLFCNETKVVCKNHKEAESVLSSLLDMKIIGKGVYLPRFSTFPKRGVQRFDSSTFLDIASVAEDFLGNEGGLADFNPGKASKRTRFSSGVNATFPYGAKVVFYFEKIGATDVETLCMDIYKNEDCSGLFKDNLVYSINIENSMLASLSRAA
jgi:hypothetical protein